MSYSTLSIDGDNIYYNITIPNDNKSNISDQPIQFYENRVDTILLNPSDYYLSVVRFSINGSNIPLLIFQIQDGQFQSDPNLGIYSITLSYNGSDSTQFVEYININSVTQVPNPPSLRPPQYTQDYTPYYYIYEYQSFVDLVNNALIAAFNAIPHPANIPGVPVCAAPYMIYNTETQKFSIIAIDAYYNNKLPDANRIDIYFNSALINLIPGFYQDRNSVIPSSPNKYAHIVMANIGNNVYNIPNVTNDYPAFYLENRQQFNSITSVNSFDRIIITSSSLPVLSELLSIKNSNGSNTVLNILTDYKPNLAQSGEFKSVFIYNPTAQYRLIDMIGNRPFSRTDLQVYWSDINGNIHLLSQPFGASTNIKILFVRKDLYNKNKKLIH